MIIATILIACYVLVGYGCASVLCNKNESLLDKSESGGTIEYVLTLLSWPAEFGRLIAKAYIYYDVRLNRIKQGEYNCEPLAMLEHVYDIKELLQDRDSSQAHKNEQQ